MWKATQQGRSAATPQPCNILATHFLESIACNLPTAAVQRVAHNPQRPPWRELCTTTLQSPSNWSFETQIDTYTHTDIQMHILIETCKYVYMYVYICISIKSFQQQRVN